MPWMNIQELLSEFLERVTPAIAGPKPSPRGKEDGEWKRSHEFAYLKGIIALTKRQSYSNQAHHRA